MSSEVAKPYGALTFFMRDFFTPNLKMLFAAHHFVYKSKDIHEIASVVNIKVDIIEELDAVL